MPGKTRPDTITLSKVIPRFEASAERGLTASQAKERLENGYGNTAPASAEKSTSQIFKDNVFTYFNLIFVVLALCVIAVGSYNDLTFMPVVIINSAIGVVQELRSKRALSKLTFIAAPRATVIRDREQVTIPSSDAVLDDIAVISAGQQVYADAIVLTGECQVNEALVTGEADEITKTAGDTLLSGSFVVSGECRARLDKVGADSFVSQLTVEAKRAGKLKQTGMMFALTRLVQVIGFIIIPFGIILFYQQRGTLGRSVTDSVVSTVAALIGMIPEGLYLLVSIALTVSIMRLTKKKTLVHEMACIETLARVDVLCVDKTGTITESRMEVRGIVPLCEDRFNSTDLEGILTDYISNMGDENDTMSALKARFPKQPRRTAATVVPFSSSTKFGGVSFSADETYLLGAPEKIMRSEYAKIQDGVEEYSKTGHRVLLLALYDGDVHDKVINPNDVMPLCLVYLSNRVRAEAPATFAFFQKSGVKIVVISGDNPVTVSHVACEAGIDGAEHYIDAGELSTQRKIKRAVSEYVVFGRVTPDQKRKLIRALKAKGHTVAMTGDGVNDVLALKDADCSVAMASGSDVASQVSNLVLLSSNFAAMPSVVMEGRRVINNIERSAALFLQKNIFSFLLAVITMVFALSYPIKPSQLSLYSALLIGLPSFVLALEPNKKIVEGRFLVNVIRSALPAGLTNLAAVLAAVLLCRHYGISDEQMSTMSTFLISFVGLLMLIKLCLPLNSLRIALIATVVITFAAGGIVLSGLFELYPLSGRCIGLLALIAAGAVPMMFGLCILTAPKPVRRR